eukprot:7674449-Pyramimonas_sp.AAC.1
MHDLSLNTFMDDITKTHTFLPNTAAADIISHLNGVTTRLEAKLAKGNWCLNPQKTNHLLHIRGEGCFGTTRLLRKSKTIKGNTMREMRVLGPYLPSEQGFSGEVHRRCEAARLAWRQGG